jgi:hypothetical protein
VTLEAVRYTGGGKCKLIAIRSSIERGVIDFTYVRSLSFGVVVRTFTLMLREASSLCHSILGGFTSTK